MSSIKLFQEWERQSKDHIRLNESEFSYLDRSDRPKIAEIRSTLNILVFISTGAIKKSSKAEFMAKDNFDGVFYELFLSYLFENYVLMLKLNLN